MTDPIIRKPLTEAEMAAYARGYLAGLEQDRQAGQNSAINEVTSKGDWCAICNTLCFYRYGLDPGIAVCSQAHADEVFRITSRRVSLPEPHSCFDCDGSTDSTDSE